MKPLSISLCMIVKNEERFIGQCLESAHPYVDEIILCDTGSTDSTLEIAKKFPKVKIVTFQWNGSFADARNASLKGATSEWIIFLDADEVLAAESGGRIRETLRLLNLNKISAAFIEIYNASEMAPPEKVLSGECLLGNQTVVPRLLLNTPDIFFEGSIHENFGDSVVRSRRHLGQTDLKIVHYGSMEEVRKGKNKVERNVVALCNAIAENPSNPWYYGYLAQEMYDFPDEFPESMLVAVCEEGWKLAQTSSFRMSIVRLGVMHASMFWRKGEFKKMLEVLEKVEMTDGPTADSEFLAGMAYQELAQLEKDGSNEQLYYLLEAEQRYKFAITSTTKETFVMGSSSFQALNQLGWVSFAFAEFDEAKSCWEGVLKLLPDHPSAKKGLSHLATEAPNEAIGTDASQGPSQQ